MSAVAREDSWADSLPRFHTFSTSLKGHWFNHFIPIDYVVPKMPTHLAVNSSAICARYPIWLVSGYAIALAENCIAKERHCEGTLLCFIKLTMNPYILYSVTALGFLLSLLSMLFIFKGKPIAGAGTEQYIEWGTFKIRMNSVTTLFIVSLVAATLPLGLEFYLVKQRCCIIDDSLQKGTVSERKCESLKGEYKLSQYYEFINTGGIKATARNGSWITDTCKSLEDGSVF